MNEQDSRAALIAMGITPTRELIRNWLAVEAAGDEEQSGGRSQPGQVGQVIQAEQPFLSSTSSRAIEGSETLTVDGGAASPTHPGSKSRLEPLLREAGTLEKPPGRRRAGRPRIIASWFERVADTMKDGSSLRMALAVNGINALSKSEIRALYRNKTFQAMYQEARRRYLLEHYGKKPSLRALIGKYL